MEIKLRTPEVKDCVESDDANFIDMKGIIIGRCLALGWKYRKHLETITNKEGDWRYAFVKDKLIYQKCDTFKGWKTMVEIELDKVVLATLRDASGDRLEVNFGDSCWR